MPPALLEAPPVKSPTVVRPPAMPKPVLHGADLVVRFNNGSVKLPGMAPSFDAVRAWKQSDDAPHTGKWSYLGDHFEIDLSMESVFHHGYAKVEIISVLRRLLKPGRRGWVSCDATTLTEDEAGLNCEPDGVVVLAESVLAGRVRYTPKANRPQESVEIVGAADVVLEVVSDSSVGKDVRLEPPLLFAAGVREFWRADCRGERCAFEIFARGPADWEPVPADADGFRPSAVLGRRYRLVRLPPRAGLPRFRVDERDL